MRFRFTIPTVIMGFMASCTLVSQADEGMWLFNNLPRKQLADKYKFEPTAEWLDHVMKSSVRFNSGGSGSFVSSTGLVLTNHHVGADTLHKVSTAEHDYYKEGFWAKTLQEEAKAPDLELNVLQSIEDVTERVNAAVKPGSSPGEAFAARRGVIAAIEKESLEKTGFRSDVVTLYQGGQYHLYRYKKYTDIRLVFAPEFEIAFFGGDPDNFEYPRYDLDVCLFRAYENDKPAKIEHFLKWSAAGAAEGELVFVSGHPGRTSRLNTVAALNYLRDYQAPAMLDFLRRMEIMLQQFGQRSEENSRIAKEDLFGVQNSRKAYYGKIAGLQDPGIMGKKAAAEKEFRAKVEADPKLKADFGTAWEKIEKAQAIRKEMAILFNVLEGGRGFTSETFGIARTLVRLAEESEKPNAERLREYGDAGRASLELQLYSDAPIYTELEIAKLTDALGFMLEKLGGDNPLAQKVLAGKSPAARASELILGSKLRDVAVRKQIAAGGKKAIAESTDPMIALAKLIDPEARVLRKKFDDEVTENERQGYAQIAKAIFQLQGTSNYPDATFTLRL
ncbi:MAG: S46 family peptidase, partial [Planctomycetes bacterium]|nr:S46 family peptidase [Planctomycetota bacterium]